MAMNNIQSISSNNNKNNIAGNGYKVIEVNVSNPSENLFAVCTPVKIK
jgi:hypothetical protein